LLIVKLYRELDEVWPAEHVLLALTARHSYLYKP